MSQKEELFNQYEDAFFAILMDRVAEEEGRKAIALNQQLKEDPEAAVPDLVRQRCEKAIRKAFSAQTRKKTGRILWKGIQTAAIVVLLVAAMLTISFAAFPTFRANVLNMILNVYETHTNFSFNNYSDVSNSLDITPLWMPEACVLVQEESSIDSYYQYYEDDSGNNVFIQKILADGQEIALDTEDAQVEDISVQGYDGTMIVKDLVCQIIWLVPEQNVCILVATTGFTEQEILQIVDNLMI